VILNGLDGNLPALDRVAALALGAELAAVNIGVAIRASLADILEDKAGVTLRAVNFRVHPTQRISSGVVVELRDCPNRPPACVRVAVLTRYCDGSVRICDLGMRPPYIPVSYTHLENPFVTKNGSGLCLAPEASMRDSFNWKSSPLPSIMTR